jgi:hypothetical protein
MIHLRQPLIPPMTGSRFWITRGFTPNARSMIIILPRRSRSRTCNSTPRPLSLVRPPQAACNFPNPIHPIPYPLPHHQISHPRCPSKLRILMIQPPIDPPSCLKRSTWTEYVITAVTWQIRSTGGGSGGRRYHAPPLGPRFVRALSNVWANVKVQVSCLRFFFSLSLAYIS